MNDETNILAIEERLQAEAKRLLAAEAADRRVSTRLWARYRRRRRAVQTAMGAGTALSLVLALWIGWQRHEQEPPQVAAVGRAESVRGYPESRSTTLAALDLPLDGSSVAIPFVISDASTGEEVISGVFVPEQVEPIDQLDLSPAERDAVRAVLGIEGLDDVVIQPI
jgi:hypothetical protein